MSTLGTGVKSVRTAATSSLKGMVLSHPGIHEKVPLLRIFFELTLLLVL
ncbi:MAG: hypothetical protein HC908_01890 [Calothrix sp. SM1_7_51]|nr:hypothetical protein [Calothrix sp. SM1_7_51]